MQEVLTDNDMADIDLPGKDAAAKVVDNLAKAVSESPIVDTVKQQVTEMKVGRGRRIQRLQVGLRIGQSARFSRLVSHPASLPHDCSAKLFLKFRIYELAICCRRHSVLLTLTQHRRFRRHLLPPLR